MFNYILSFHLLDNIYKKYRIREPEYVNKSKRMDLKTTLTAR